VPWSSAPACQTAVSSFPWTLARVVYSSASFRRSSRKLGSVESRARRRQRSAVRDQVGVPYGALSRRCLSFIAGNLASVSALCPLDDSIPLWREFQGDSGSVPARPILSWSFLCWSYDMASRPRDLADRMAGRRKLDDGYLRETFTLPRDKARSKARDFLTRYPKAAYMSGVESWRELPDGDIEFTMRRLRSAD
jgi:hypothetical protein